MIKYYKDGVKLYRGVQYGICLDFDVRGKTYLKISCEYGLELISTVNSGRNPKYDISRIIGVDMI